MTAGKYDFVIEQGATWAPILTYKDEVGTPIDLTGCNGRLMARQDFDDEAYIDVSTDNGKMVLGGVDGTIMPRLEPSETADITVVAGKYDLEIWSSTETIRVLQGAMLLSREITRS